MDFSYTEELVIKNVRPAAESLNLLSCSSPDKDVLGAFCIHYSGRNMCGHDVLVKPTASGFLFSSISTKSPWVSSPADFSPFRGVSDGVEEDLRKAYAEIVEMFLRTPEWVDRVRAVKDAER